MVKIFREKLYYLNFRHLSLLDFGLEICGKTKNEKLFKIDQN